MGSNDVLEHMYDNICRQPLFGNSSPSETIEILPQFSEQIGKDFFLCGELHRVTDLVCLVKRPKVLLYRFYSLAEFPDEVPEDDSENYDTITVEEMYGGSAYEAEGDDCIWKE